jgi:hypothetical protein
MTFREVRMNHRHLLPAELDLLLDGEVGFGVSPLRAHVEACADCRARLDEARIVVDVLDDLPRFAPAPSFADRVMANVQVVEPWHVAVVAGARRFVPQSTPMRVVMAATASVVAVAISSAAVWLAIRADVAMYLAGLADDRVRSWAATTARTAAQAVFGAGAVDALAAQGPAAFAALAAGIAVSAGGAALGLRSLAAAARRTQE